MSKTSARQRYIQLMEWLPTFKKSKSTSPKQSSKAKKESRLNYYKSKGYKNG